MALDIKQEVTKYLKNATVHQNCTMTGDYKKGNMAARFLGSINNELLKEEADQTQAFIDEILSSDMPNAIMWIVPVCVSLNYRIDFVKMLLQTYAADKNIGLLSFDASMLLRNIKK